MRMHWLPAPHDKVFARPAAKDSLFCPSGRVVHRVAGAANATSKSSPTPFTPPHTTVGFNRPINPQVSHPTSPNEINIDRIVHVNGVCPGGQPSVHHTAQAAAAWRRMQHAPARQQSCVAQPPPRLPPPHLLLRSGTTHTHKAAVICCPVLVTPTALTRQCMHP